MTQSWMQPVAEPLFVHLWTEELAAKDHSKPTALGTRFRYSSALNCSRRLVFDALEVPQSDPIDPAGIHVTTMGTIIHEKVQEAIGRKYPGAKFEVVSGNEIVSGSADGVAMVGGSYPEKMLLELKTVGGFAFNKAIGVSGYKRTAPEGPRPSAIVQAGLNALHNDCQTVVVMYIAMEALSKQRAETLGFSMYDRFTAEWHIPEDVWRPLAEAEMRRLEFLAGYADERLVPPGSYFDDKKFEWEFGISPNDNRPKWTCSYCPHLTTCKAHEEGVDVLP